MPTLPRFVFDTNMLVSVLLVGNSAPSKVFAHAETCGVLLASAPTIDEFNRVLRRRKFDRYLSRETRFEFFRRYCAAVEMVAIKKEVKICRDPEDDKFLEVALNGQAQYLLTGDADLLALHSYRSVRIITPRAFIVECLEND